MRLPADAVLPEVSSLKARSPASTRPATGSSGARPARRAPATRRRSSTRIERIQFDQPIASFQIQQQKLAEMALEVNRATLVALHLGRMKDAGTLRPEHVSLGKLGNVNGGAGGRAHAPARCSAPTASRSSIR